ncbi:Rossmann-fold NAD(P)-binding domain-containing protein [Pedobacter agri]|uniref:hypothetical protein n=1 Tax=Pedobacter agri TaxID=454586 RepID=UPI001EE63B9C|nr:hypothetical protein [Pedobacter agri]
MRILVTAPYNDQGREILEKNFGEVIYKTWKDQGRSFNESELITLLGESKADALITEHDHVTEKVIDSYPNLQFIGVCRGTPSNVALHTARKTWYSGVSYARQKCTGGSRNVCGQCHQSFAHDHPKLAMAHWRKLGSRCTYIVSSV